jgi:acid phosphatase type 7
MKLPVFLVTGYVAGAAARCAIANGTVPMQLRLAYAGTPGMTVSWNTYCQLDHPTVFFGEHHDKLTRRATSDVSVTYPTSTTFNNHVKLVGLKPNTRYYYLPVHSNVTAPYTFTTAREPGDTTPFSIAFVADLGTMGPDGLTTTTGVGASNPLLPGENNTIQSLAAFQSQYDLVWHGKTFQ